jgi:hypothetical protein
MAKEVKLEEGEQLFTAKFLIERWTDAIKVLGTGNVTGLLANIAAFQLAMSKPEIMIFVKIAAILFFLGIFAFMAAYAHLLVWIQESESTVTDIVGAGFWTYDTAFFMRRFAYRTKTPPELPPPLREKTNLSRARNATFLSYSLLFLACIVDFIALLVAR